MFWCPHGASYAGYKNEQIANFSAVLALRTRNRLRRTHYAYSGQTLRRLRRRSANAYLIPELIHFESCFLPCKGGLECSKRDSNWSSRDAGRRFAWRSVRVGACATKFAYWSQFKAFSSFSLFSFLFFFRVDTRLQVVPVHTPVRRGQSGTLSGGHVVTRKVAPFRGNSGD